MMPMRIHRFETVGSTNDIALEMARRGELEGTVVLARSQSSGRGRRGRVWIDEPGSCVLMSVILRPDLPLERLPELTFVASVAVAEWLKGKFDLMPALKWPNDVLVGGRKIAGVLVETTGTAAVIGIGLNVNQASFPPEIAESATSVAVETGSDQDVEAAGESLARAVCADYGAYLARGFEEILTRWRRYMWGVGKQASVTAEGRVLQGAVLGVDSSGALLLRDSGDEVHVIRVADSLSFSSVQESFLDAPGSR